MYTLKLRRALSTIVPLATTIRSAEPHGKPMRRWNCSGIPGPLMIAAAALALGSYTAGSAYAASGAIGAPDKIETRFGLLEYKDGIPTAATVEKMNDNLDFMHA